MQLFADVKISHDESNGMCSLRRCAIVEVVIKGCNLPYTAAREEDCKKEVEMLNEIASLRKEISEATDEGEKAALNSRLQAKQLAVSVALEKFKRKK